MAHWAYRALAPRLAALLVGVCTLAVTVVRAELSATVYGNTALAGPPVLNTTVAELAGVLHLLEPWQSVVVEGQITATEWAVFSVDTDSGFVRLRVDDHLLVDGGPAAALPPSCSFPGGDPSELPATFSGKTHGFLLMTAPAHVACPTLAAIVLKAAVAPSARRCAKSSRPKDALDSTRTNTSGISAQCAS